eukprot:COSAG01_NODE_175_length_22996_cov_18.857892_17_plen_124_part_00
MVSVIVVTISLRGREPELAGGCRPRLIGSVPVHASTLFVSYAAARCCVAAPVHFTLDATTGDCLGPPNLLAWFAFVARTVMAWRCTTHDRRLGKLRKDCLGKARRKSPFYGERRRCQRHTSHT